VKTVALLLTFAVTLPAAGQSLADARDDALTAQNAWHDAAIQNKACVDAVYAALDFAPLLPHLPRRMPQVTNDQRADSSLATDAEIKAMQATHPRMQACHAAMTQAITPTLPTVAPILADDAAKAEAQLFALMQRKQNWGQYTTNVIAIGAETELALRAEDRRLGSIAARAVVKQDNANAAAYSREMQSVQSGLHTPRPAVTGCTDVGKGCAPN
jgi:hypothetical protein